MDAVEALESLELLGADQWGLVTSAQAQDNGISKVWLQRLNARGVLQRLRHGVYGLPSSQPGHLRDVQGAWLSVSTTALEPESDETAWPAVVSGASAAALHKIGDLLPPYIEFSVPATAHQQAIRCEASSAHTHSGRRRGEGRLTGHHGRTDHP